MTTQDIHDALKFSIFTGGWCYLQEFRAGTGYSESSNRYLDGWAIQTYPSKPMLIAAIEIKLSRSDWLRELKQPQKRDPALRIANQFYFAAPLDLIDASELPAECGLIEIYESPGVGAIIEVEAPHREIQITLPYLASLARRCEDRSRTCKP